MYGRSDLSWAHDRLFVAGVVRHMEILSLDSQGKPMLPYTHPQRALAIDAHARIAFTWMYRNETKENAINFLRKAHAWFGSLGGVPRRS